MKKVFSLTILTLLILACKADIRNENDNQKEVEVKKIDASDEFLQKVKIETKLPLVTIQTENNAEILDRENWINAKMKIENANEKSWNFDGMDAQIRGRGSFTWGEMKKPYALKLSEKKEICGMPKHKRWVLIANYLDNSFMKNEIAFELSRKLEMDYTIRGEFVNLVLNGDYVGLYWLGEQIKVDKNRVNIDEENDFLFEIDEYFDEPWEFRSTHNWPYMIKNDEEMTDQKLTTIKAKIGEIEQRIEKNDLSNLDFQSFAQMYAVQEIMGNSDLYVMESSPFVRMGSFYATYDSKTEKLKAGPTWDFDRALLVEFTKNGEKWKNSIFRWNMPLYYPTLFKNVEFKAELKKQLEKIDKREMENFVETLREKLRKSVEYDWRRWPVRKESLGKTFANYDEAVDVAKNLLLSRIDFVKNTNGANKGFHLKSSFIRFKDELRWNYRIWREKRRATQKSSN